MVVNGGILVLGGRGRWGVGPWLLGCPIIVANGSILVLGGRGGWGVGPRSFGCPTMVANSGILVLGGRGGWGVGPWLLGCPMVVNSGILVLGGRIIVARKISEILIAKRHLRSDECTLYVLVGHGLGHRAVGRWGCRSWCTSWERWNS